MAFYKAERNGTKKWNPSAAAGIYGSLFFRKKSGEPDVCKNGLHSSLQGLLGSASPEMEAKHDLHIGRRKAYLDQGKAETKKRRVRGRRWELVCGKKGSIFQKKSA